VCPSVLPVQLPDTAARAPFPVVPVILVAITAVVIGLYLRRTRQSR
jgi:hypothetical protein